MTTKEELKDYCRKKGIKGYSQLNKAEIEKLVKKYKKQTKPKTQKITQKTRPKIKVNKNLAIELKYPEYVKAMIAHIGGDMDINYKKLNIDDLYFMLIRHKQINLHMIPKEIIRHNRSVLKRYGTDITLYKGMSDTLFKQKGTSKKILISTLEGTFNNGVSWTDKKEIAHDWASEGAEGYIVKSRIPINKILISYHGSFILKDAGENEFIVLPFNIQHISTYHKIKMEKK